MVRSALSPSASALPKVGHVLATQCLLQRKPRTFAINVRNRLPAGVTAKDLILAIIGKIASPAARAPCSNSAVPPSKPCRWTSA
jgi:hypothetical protein